MDPNVLISCALSSWGAPRELLRLWLNGEYEMIVSRELLHELQAVLVRPKFRAKLPYPGVIRYVAYLADRTTIVEQPKSAGGESIPDPDDRYLAAFAAKESAVLVSGDRHLHPEAITPREFVEIVEMLHRGKQ